LPPLVVTSIWPQRRRTPSGGTTPRDQRLDLGVALVGDPDLVFLDEPTTGFDPAARRNAWELIRSLRALGKTILLTTHYLDEAQQLADRVAVLRAGEIVRIGRPSELTASASVQIRYRRLGEQVVLETDEPTRALHELTARALAEDFELEELEIRRATLEVRRSNLAALRLYEDLGFEVAGVRKRYYTNPEEDALILWREPLDGAPPDEDAA
jgi:ABC-2 type transport system ATP-binding protein